VPPRDPHRILIVEDDAGTAALQRRALERAGYQTALAVTAEDALESVRRSRPHLVLLDNLLQGEINGLQFLSSLKAIAPEVPVIMVTGSETEGAVLQALRGGARDFIHKEMDYLDQLPRAVASVLRESRVGSNPDGEPLGATPAVLIVADPNTATLERRQLERAGLPTVTAANAAEAVRVLSESKVCVLVIDREAAGGRGIEAYRQIKAAGHDLPAVLLSPNADDSVAVEALRAGFQEFLLKRGDYLTQLQEAAQRLSHRARLEAQVAESKARLAGIVNSAMDPILLLDEGLRITMFNPAAENLFQTTAEQAAGQPIGRFIAGAEDLIAGTARGPAGTAQFEARGIRPGSEPAELELSVARMEAGGRVFVSVIARDVSRRRELERLLLQKDKLESLGLLAGGIAHDFNNLLVGILGNASLALETVSSSNPARAMLKDVVMASETAANLTRQLLAYAGKGRFVVEPVDLSELVRQISNLLLTSIPKHVQLRMELASDLPSVEADTTQLQQLVMNLVINGAEAIGEDGGTVLISTGRQNVDDAYIASALTADSIRPGEYVDLQVHDTGAGMSQDTLDRIFDPFFTTKFTGRGLGLAAVLGIVRGHKGAIKVYSTPGRGTTFKVLFPASGQAAARPAPRLDLHNAPAGKTVLVVDDEAIVRRTAKAMLERHGYAVVLAENGREAVDLYKVLVDKIDLVLLDMTMPILGGEETFRLMKGIHPNVRVVLSSGFNEVEAIRRFTGKGLAGFLQKPYSALTLVEKVKAVLAEQEEPSQDPPVD
jgi:PAS domain S-box-containing protein